MNEFYPNPHTASEVTLKGDPFRLPTIGEAMVQVYLTHQMTVKRDPETSVIPVPREDLEALFDAIHHRRDH